MLISFTCAHCGCQAQKETGHVNRSRRDGLSLFCGRVCSGLGRRKNITASELKERKRLYDIEYRSKNLEKITANKQDYFQRIYNPQEAAIARAQQKKEHPEHEAARRLHMASPEYRATKKRYDRRHKADNKYGKAWGECMVLALDIRDECLDQMSAYEIRQDAGTNGKSQNRRRDYDRLNSTKAEIGPLGHAGRTS